MPLSDYIDNDHHKLEAILKQLIQDKKQFDVDIATDFCRIDSWSSVKLSKND